MLLKDMLECYSPTGYEGNLVDYLIKWANKNGFKAYKDKVGNFIAKKGEGKEILLVGHVDTVPGEIPVRIEGNKLFGRGAVDAKGSLACFLEASLEVSKGKIIVVGAVDEEGDSKGAKNILNKFNPEYIIIGEPSGYTGITLGYKGRIKLTYTNKKTKEHTSIPTLNCYEQGIFFYNRIKQFLDRYNTKKRVFDQIHARITAIQTESDDFSEKMILKITFRIPEGYAINTLKDYITDLCQDATIHFSEFEESVRTEKNNLLVSAFIGAIRNVDGEPTFKYKTGTSDMNILKNLCVPIVAYGPGNSSLDHTPKEFLDLNEYQTAVTVVKNVLHRITQYE